MSALCAVTSRCILARSPTDTLGARTPSWGTSNMPKQTPGQVLAAVPVSNAPLVQLSRIPEIRTVEVMTTELNQIEDAASEEKTAFGFFTLCVGAFLSALPGIPADGSSPQRWALFYVIVGMTGAGSAWF